MLKQIVIVGLVLGAVVLGVVSIVNGWSITP